VLWWVVGCLVSYLGSIVVCFGVFSSVSGIWVLLFLLGFCRLALVVPVYVGAPYAFINKVFLLIKIYIYIYIYIYGSLVGRWSSKVVTGSYGASL
jgi:hypothetical protein